MVKYFFVLLLGLDIISRIKLWTKLLLLIFSTGIMGLWLK